MRRRRHRLRSQATLEFAFVAPLFLVCFFASIDAGLWAVQNGAEVSAVEQGARLAAAAGAQPVAVSGPDARSVTAAIQSRLQQALFATRIVAWCNPAAGEPCAPPPAAACAGAACAYARCPATPAQVEAVFGPRAVALCVEERTPPPCAAAAAGSVAATYCHDTPMITVRLVGHVASLVPPGFGLGGGGGEIPSDIGATTHTLRFAP